MASNKKLKQNERIWFVEKNIDDDNELKQKQSAIVNLWYPIDFLSCSNVCAIGHQPDRQYDRERERKNSWPKYKSRSPPFLSLSLLFKFVRKEKTDT
jgi:hypothetical protein